MFSSVHAESYGKLVFHGIIQASSPFSELVNGSTSATLGTGVGTTMNLQLALHSGPVTVGDAQTVNEVSTSTWPTYVRQNVIRSTGGWTFTSPNKFENAGTITFPANTGGTATFVSYLTIGSLANATSNNRVLFVIPLAIETPRPFVLDDTTGDVIRVPTHGYADNQEVMFLKVEGASLPSGITEGTLYYVRASGKTTDTFTISTTAGGGAVAITTQGSGYCVAVGTKSIGVNDPLVFDTTNKITVFIR